MNFILKMIGATIITLVVWVGSAQLALYLFGPQHPLLLIFGVAGMFGGIQLGFGILFGSRGKT